MKRLLTALVLACNAPAALACGYCVEDKMAAAYDHAVVTRSLGQKHHVAFFHVEGNLVPGDAMKRALEALAESAAGVDKGSVRVSVELAALSVAFDPQRAPVAKLQSALERKLATRKVSLMLLQVMDRPANFSPSVLRALRAAGK
ncbi:MAG: hypothetical protein AABM33_02360 [Pseudomonadota bacterium]